MGRCRFWVRFWGDGRRIVRICAFYGWADGGGEDRKARLDSQRAGTIYWPASWLAYAGDYRRPSPTARVRRYRIPQAASRPPGGFEGIQTARPRQDYWGYAHSDQTRPVETRRYSVIWETSPPDARIRRVLVLISQPPETPFGEIMVSFGNERAP